MQQGSRFDTIFWTNTDAYARRNPDSFLSDSHFLGNFREYSLRHRQQMFARMNLPQQDNKLIAAKTRHGIRFSNTAPNSLRHFNQYQITCFMLWTQPVNATH